MQDAEAGNTPPQGTGSRALRNTAIVLTARVASRLVALVTVIATLNHLGPAGSGKFGVLVNYTALVTVILDLGLNTLYVREGARHPGELGRYLGNLIVARALTAIVALGVLAILSTIVC